MKELKFGKYYINENSTPIVIPDIGINHGGDFEVAKKMVYMIKEAGGQFVKHQSHIPNKEMSTQCLTRYPMNANKSIYKVIESCTLSEDEDFRLKEYAESLGLIYLSTPFCFEAVDRLQQMDLCAYKIGSGEFNNHALIKHIATTKKTMILSTGMNDFKSIDNTVSILNELDINFALLHCTSAYPTKAHQVRLKAIQQLRERYSCLVGYSDHSIGLNAARGSVFYGAKIIEKHFTDSHKRVGPDINCSMDPTQMKQLIYDINEFVQMQEEKNGLLDEEIKTRDFAFGSIFTKKEIREGDILTKDNITIKRPFNSDAVDISEFNKLLGKKTLKDMTKDTYLVNGDFCD